MITLYTDKNECCGCSACRNVCPNQAIKMEQDSDGFIYPTIKTDLCIKCGICIGICAFQNVPANTNEPLSTYAAVNRNQSVLKGSASGGIFGALSSTVFEKNGIVFGCAFNSEMEPEHICIDDQNNMEKLQGSKYVQSSINTTYTEAKNYLEQGREVLYTGTPCQIAGLKNFLGKEYENLITTDIICHGVPSVAFFKGYIEYLECKLKGKVIDFKFRDKSKGWSLMAKVVYRKNGTIHEKVISPITSYYYSYFLRGLIYRESCYECKYASSSRQGDFTMGDYWGIEKAHPEVDMKDGVSILLVNSEKGMALLAELTKYLALTESTFEQARDKNGQLKQPTRKSDKRSEILKTWRENGYNAVADEYYMKNKKQIIRYKVVRYISQPAKILIKKVKNYIS